MESENKREEKLEGRTIRFGDGTVIKRERPHGKVYQWFDNFWYHHKWKTIIISFFLIVFIICTVQMCNRAPEADINVLIATPTNFVNEPEGTAALEALLSSYLPLDYNENGRKDVSIRHYMILSEEQIKAIESIKDEANNTALYVNHATASDNYKNFYSYLQTGEAAILILDRWAFERVKADGLLVNLSTQMEGLSQGALYEPDGGCYGISLKETELYREQIAFHVLEEEFVNEEPVICMLSKLVTTDDARYDVAMEAFQSLLK